MAGLSDLPVGLDDAIGVPGDLCSDKRLTGFPSDRELDVFVPNVSFTGSNEFVEGRLTEFRNRLAKIRQYYI